MSKNTYTGPKTPGKRLTTKEFIRRARAIHQNKYDYSKVVYKNANTKVIIICKEHGEFRQTPDNHLHGQNCPVCSRLSTNQKRSSNIRDFIKSAKKVHGNRYDYSKVVYKNNNTKVTIICQIHGEFEQSPGNHRRGQGCPKCGAMKAIKNRTYTKEEFTKRAKKVHGNKYNYSKVVYKNYGTKVLIICPIHGEFEQDPAGHLSGHGCKKCAVENATFDLSHDKNPGHLYLIICKTTNESFCKVGTAYDTKQRFNQFPFVIGKTQTVSGIRCDMEKLEKQVKRQFKKDRYSPGFKFPGYTECFQLEAFNKIKKYLTKYQDHGTK